MLGRKRMCCSHKWVGFVLHRIPRFASGNHTKAQRRSMTREKKRNRAQEEKTIYSLSRRLDEEDKDKKVLPSSANPSEQWCEFTPVPFSPASSSSKSLNVLGTTTFSPPPPPLFVVVVVALVVVFVLLLLRLCVPPPPKNMIDVASLSL